MIKTFQFKLKPNTKQRDLLDNWLNLLRMQYNYRLAQRFNWYEQNRSNVNACSLVCHLPELKEQPNYYSQKKDLLNTKKLFPDYKNVQSQVLQDCIKRVDKTFSRWLKQDKSGRRSGRPRFKGKGRYRSFTFPQTLLDCIQGKQIKFSKIGLIKFIKHREIPQGFLIKTATIIKKANGFYVNLSVENKSIPDFKPDTIPSLNNTIGIDMGLKEFLVCSDGVRVEIQQYYRLSAARLRRLQKSLSRKKKGSNNWLKAVEKVAKLHQHISDKRKDFHYNVAKLLINKADVIAHEKLNIKGLAKTRFSKSILDAGWGMFLQILKCKAENAGVKVIEVNPNGTSVECSNCGAKVPKTLKDRIHSCGDCDIELCRDLNASINIKYRAVGHSVALAYRVTEAIAGVGKKPTLTASAEVMGVCHY